MCGIFGYFSLNGHKIDAEKIRLSVSKMVHRGPDDWGYAVLNSVKGLSKFERELTYEGMNKIDADIVLGHRRLSIIDLSPLGRQPMSDEKGEYWLVFNGGIYNYIELRDELKTLGYAFGSNSDTEVIIKSYIQWGEDCLKRFNGMFAIALWDMKKKKIFCARDRMGVKPFYYYFDGEKLICASEIKAILEMGVKKEPNNQIVYDYLTQDLIDHTEETFFAGIKQIRGGHYIIVSTESFVLKKWWDIEDNEILGLSDEEYAEKFLELFTDSLRIRLRSDVPIGTCLSGGLDSSSIVCVANKLMFNGKYSVEIVGGKQRTFSSCFENLKYDEREYIEEVIKKTGVIKNYTFPDVKNFFEIISSIIYQQEEPFKSTSIYAQWHVMKLASENGVKVLLDGQGADELLCGYHRYFRPYYNDMSDDKIGLLRELYYYRKIHGKWRLVILDMMFGDLKKCCPNFIKNVYKWCRTEKTVGQKSQRKYLWINKDYEDKYEKEYIFPEKFSSALKNELYKLFFYTSLPALLHYGDRDSMAFSIEARVPFLDYRLVEYIFSLPSRQKLRNGMTKIVLRNSMKGILPEKIRRRVDKKAFVTPEAFWFRTVLKDKLKNIINSPEFKSMGIFDLDKLNNEFEKFFSGEKNDSFFIWRCVNLSLWKKAFFGK